MIIAAEINSENIVQNLVVVGSLTERPNLVVVPDWIKIGDHIDTPKVDEPHLTLPDGTVIQPMELPTQTIIQKVTPLQFIDRFTDDEQLAIVTATMSIPQVKLWYDKLIASTEVVLSDPRLATGLNALVVAGLLTQARLEEILPQPTTGVQVL